MSSRAILYGAAMVPTARHGLNWPGSLTAGQIATEGAQVWICFRFEDENAHGAAPLVIDDLVLVGGNV